MKKLLLTVFFLLSMTALQAQEVMWIPKGDAKALLVAIEVANKKNADKDAKQLFIMIPDGFYDLGATVLTKITGHNIALIGQSMEGTIIQNKPDVKKEGISKTAIFQNRGTGNYFQDMTLKNALDYYAAGVAGRAVTLQDKGTRTICIICGDGDVWFERCKIVTEKRTTDGSGRNVIAAPKTSKTPWGYILNRCTVENIVSNFEYARGWNGTPHCIWLHTTLLSPEKLNKTRFDYQGMNTVQNDFKEYATMDAQGRDITPKTNVITYTMTKKKQEGDKEIVTESSYTDETILSAEKAASYTIENVFGNWHPDKIITKMERKAQKLMKRLK